MASSQSLLSSSPFKADVYSTDLSSAPPSHSNPLFPPSSSTTTVCLHQPLPPLSSCLPQKRRFLSTLNPSRQLTVKPLFDPYNSSDAAKRIFSTTVPPSTVNRSASTCLSNNHSSFLLRSPTFAKPNTLQFLQASHQSLPQVAHLQTQLDQSKAAAISLRRQLALAVDELEYLATTVESKSASWAFTRLGAQVQEVCRSRLPGFKDALEDTAWVCGGLMGQRNESVGEEEEKDEDYESLMTQVDEEEEDDDDEDRIPSSEEDDDEENSTSVLASPSPQPTLQSSSVTNLADDSDEDGLLAEDSMTASELSALVRSRISRTSIPSSRPPSSPLELNSQDPQEDVFGCDEREPTAFVRQLADTTWDPAEDVTAKLNGEGVPSKCNLMDLFMSVSRIRLRKRKRRYSSGDHDDDVGVF